MKLLIVLCALIVVSQAGYKSKVRKARGVDKDACMEEFDDLSEKDKEEVLEDLIRAMGEEEDEDASATNKISKDDRRKLLEKSIQKMKEIEADDRKDFSLKISRFSAMTHDELHKRCGSNITDEEHEAQAAIFAHNMARYATMKRSAPPASVDHCTLTGPVEDQSGCGSCWSFAGSHALTGRLRLRDGMSAPIVRLSEQQAVDCHGRGCAGGSASTAWYLYQTNGASTEFKYPYAGKEDPEKASQCDKTNGRVAVNMITHGVIRKNGQPLYGDYIHNNVEEMKHAVAEGPVTISLNFDCPDINHYSQGVYSAPDEYNNGRSTNHAIVVCGYGRDATTGKMYWRAKNSYGRDWGDNGYIKIEMGKNTCGCESSVQVPTLSETKTGSINNICEENKSCSSDSNCNNIPGSCVAGLCHCRPTCVANIVCQSDTDCGTVNTGTCAAGGDPAVPQRFLRSLVSDNRKKCCCSCKTTCRNTQRCASDMECGQQAGACQTTRKYITKPSGKVFLKECKCSDN